MTTSVTNERLTELLETFSERAALPNCGVKEDIDVVTALRELQERRAHEPAVTNMQFMECDDCRAKPGSPTLCAGCLHNRAVIEELQQRVSKPEKKV